MLAEATHAANGGAKGVAHRAVGATLFYGGLFHEAKRHFDQVTSLLETTDDAELARRFNGSPRAAALGFGRWVRLDFDAAARDAQEAAAEAERADDVMTQGYVVRLGGDLRGRSPRRGADRSQRDAVCSSSWPDTGLRTWAPAAQQFERWSTINVGRRPSFSGRRAARRVAPAFKEVGQDKIVTPVIGVLAAEAEVRNGRADEALALVEELITEIRASGLRWQEAELLRVSGEARLLGPIRRPGSRRP